MINPTRSAYLASVDPELKTLSDIGLSWLCDVPAAEAGARASSLLEVYANVQVAPAYNGTGDAMPLRNGLWIQHPPVVPILPPPDRYLVVPPDTAPAPPPSPNPSPSSGDDQVFRLGLSVFDLISAPSSWVSDVAGFAIPRKLTRFRAWGDWTRPNDSHRMVRKNGSVSSALLASFQVRGASLEAAGITTNLTFHAGPGQWDSFAAQVAGVVTVVTELAGQDWIDYIDLCNEWTEDLSAAAMAVLVNACRDADPNRKFTASVSGTPSVVVSNLAALHAAGADLDLVTPHYPRDENWMHTGPRIIQVRSALASAGFGARVMLEEENRVGGGGYQPKSADEFITAAIEAVRAGAFEFTLHTQAGFDWTKGSFESQLVEIEKQAANQLAIRVAPFLS